MKRILPLLLCLLMVIGLVPSLGIAEEAPTKIKMIVNLPTEYQEDNPVLKEINRLANVELELIVPPSTSFAEKRNMMLASGDLPDVVMFDATTDKQYLAAVEDGMLIDLTPYLASAENINKYTDEIAFLYVTNEDGSITAIPRASLNRGDGFMIRQDWLDKLGITEVPRDIDGFVEMLYRFAKEDPDGNGLDDTYAWTDNQDGYGIVTWFARAYGADFGWQVDAEGNIYHSKYTGEGFKKGLEIASKLMADGVIDPEMLVNKTAREKFLNGEIAIRGEYVGWLPRDRDALKVNVPEAQVTYAYPPANVETGETKAMNSTVTGVWWIYGVTAACKDPQKVVDFFDWCLSDEGWNILVNGVEGIHYTVNADGSYTYTSEFDSYNQWRNYFAFLRRPDIDFYVSKALSADDAQYVTEVLEYATTVNVMQAHIGHRVPYEDELAKGDWTNREVKVIMDILYGEKPVESWDDFVKEYRAGGFDIVEQEMNEWYHAFFAEK